MVCCICKSAVLPTFARIYLSCVPEKNDMLSMHLVNSVTYPGVGTSYSPFLHTDALKTSKLDKNLLHFFVRIVTIKLFL